MVLPRQKDAEARRSFEQHLMAGGMAEFLSRPSASRLEIEGSIASFLYNAPKFQELISRQREEVIVSSTRFAGWALGFILRAAEHGRPELASLLEVYRRASAMRSGKRQTRASRATIETAWKDYGCVAHLWLVDRLIGEKGFEQCADPHKLRVFLAAAEDLRGRGEAWKCGRADPQSCENMESPGRLSSA